MKGAFFSAGADSVSADCRRRRARHIFDYACKRGAAVEDLRQMSENSFSDLGLCPQLLQAIEAMGYKRPTPIQMRAIPAILQGRDIFGCAQTGTGKTAAFMLPIMQKLEECGHVPAPLQFRALVLTPTRELAEQIGSNTAMFGKHLNLSYCKAYGGVSEKPQIRMLAEGVDILVATPGRLLDLYAHKKLCFDGVEFLVLDEADRMLDMGFIPDIRKICAQLPSKRQSLLFSATMGEEIEKLARTIVVNPLKITISPESPAVEKIDQKVATIEALDKYNFLVEQLAPRAADKNFLALVFCRTKHGASKLAKRLNKEGIPADCIHGDRTQSSRQKALGKFKDRLIRVLVATDIAARGIDVKDMDMVVNYDLPDEPETYVHRIGRTARASASGSAISICTRESVGDFSAIEKYIKRNVPVLTDTSYHSEGVLEELKKLRAFRAKMAGKESRRRLPKDKDFSAEILYGERRPTAYLASDGKPAKSPLPRGAEARGKGSKSQFDARRRRAGQAAAFSEGARAPKKGGAKKPPRAGKAPANFVGKFGGKFGGRFSTDAAPKGAHPRFSKHGKNVAGHGRKSPVRPQKQRRRRSQFVNNV